MEQIELRYPNANRRITRRAHVGLVGSGDLEIIVTPSPSSEAEVFITTSVNGFHATWEAVFDRFFSTFDGAATIVIHDAGATPGSVLLRLQQAAEEIQA